MIEEEISRCIFDAVSYTHLDVYKRQVSLHIQVSSFRHQAQLFKFSPQSIHLIDVMGEFPFQLCHPASGSIPELCFPQRPVVPTDKPLQYLLSVLF